MCRDGVRLADERAQAFGERIESFVRFCGLGEEENVAVEVDSLKFVDIVDNYGSAVCLSHQAVHFGVTALAVDHNLGACGRILVDEFGVGILDAFLQL